MTEMWIHTYGRLWDIVREAVKVEADGWHGLVVSYSPTIAPDVYAALALAARETSELLLSPGVANPLSHIAPAAAGSITTVQHASDGRAVLGLGRGDSASALLGMAPMPVRDFERYVRRVHQFLSGEDVPFDTELDGGGRFPPVSSLQLAEPVLSSRLEKYIGFGKLVPLDIYATGPKVIGIGARHAERLTFSVGAEERRLDHAITTARQSAQSVGRKATEMNLGAWLPFACHDDRAAARNLISGQVATMARFSVMHGAVSNGVSQEDAHLYQTLHREYRYSGHGVQDSPQSRHLTSEFIDRFALLGNVKECIARIRGIVELGINRIVVSLPRVGADLQDAQRSYRSLVEEILPAVK